MAESLAAQQANRHSNRLRLLMVGEAWVSFLNVYVTEVSDKIKLTKRAGARKYTIETTGTGLVEIEYEPDDNFAIALYNNSR